MEQVCEASLASFRRIRPSHPDAVVILLTHYPGKSMVSPAEAATPGWAFDCVDRLADTLVPQIVICGHVHEAFGRAPSLKGVLLPGPAGGVFNM
jgi:Icc-related predicted phosphoesterase